MQALHMTTIYDSETLLVYLASNILFLISLEKLLDFLFYM